MVNKNIVVIGGGTGSFTLLSELKKHPYNITALVNMIDSGGSTGLLRDELGVLPPGDIRQCLVALSESSDILRDLFNFRFPPDTSFAGHSFGNLFLSAFELMSKDFGQAVELAEKVLNIKGRVLPITLDNCNLVLETTGGSIKGEAAIADTSFYEDERPNLYIEPKATLNPKAKTALENADAVILAPGDMYESLIPNLLVEGVPKVLESLNVPIVYVCNLVNKRHKTHNFFVHTYVEELERFSASGLITHVLYNTERPNDELLQKYAQDNEFLVEFDAQYCEGKPYQAIGGEFLADEAIAHKGSNDILLKRSYIRHDAQAVHEQLVKIL